MAKLPKFNKVDYLVDRKFGSRGARESRKSPSQAKRVSEYRDQLLNLSQEELDARVADEQIKHREEIQAKAGADERARFFNQPSAAADFDHWSKAAYWSLDEAVALSFGKEPGKVNWENVKSLTKISQFAFQYERRRDLMKRAVPFKQLYDPVMPGVLLAWAKRNELDVPSELEVAVTSRGTQVADWKTLYDKQRAIAEAAEAALVELQQEIEQLQQSPSAKGLSTKERESLLKLVIGMAVDGYGYDPSTGRSPIPTEIASQLAMRGIPLDPDTVRKYLKEAGQLLPPQEEADI